jgi:hypothetical protein
MSQDAWREMAAKYLRNPIIIFAIVEFFVLMGFVYYMLKYKR